MSNRTASRPALLLIAACLMLAACGATPAETGSQSAASKPSAIETSDARTVAPSGQTPGPIPAGTAAPSGGSAITPTPDPITAGPAVTTACGLITQQEATAALGSDPGPGQETPLGDTASACTYVSGKSSLQLSLTPVGGKAVYDREWAGIPAGTAGITEVSGVGDGAFSQVNGARAAINFDKDDALVVIGLTTAGSPPTQDQLTTLATAAAGRV